MRKVAWILPVIMASALASVASNCAAQVRQATPTEAGSLRTFLQKLLGEPYPPFERDGKTRYSAAFVDLNDDGVDELIVYVTGRAWCGTGGCQMLVMAPEGTSFRVVTGTTVTRPPIRMLATKSNGWHDISVLVTGGGIQLGYEAELSFDGTTYPSNPSMAPAHRLENEAPGITLVSSTTNDVVLYPNETPLGQLPEGSETIVPGHSIGRLRLGMKKEELKVSWQAEADSTSAHENPCKDTELVWFDNESRWHTPGIRAYISDELTYEITSEWDRRFTVEGVGIVFGKTLQDIQSAMPGGKLLQLKGSAFERPGEADELFWVDSERGIAFGLDYPRGSTPQNRSNRLHRLHRIVTSVTVFRPQDRFQPHGCANPNEPLVAAESAD